MTPKANVIETHFGKFMIWQTDIALFKRLSEIHASQIDERIIIASKSILEVLRNYSHNQVVLDIGANAGTFSIPLAISFPEVQFHCFEIQRLVFQQLCGNAFLNGLENVFPHNYAIGNKNSTIEIPILDNYEKTYNVGGYTLDQSSLARLRAMIGSDYLKSNKSEFASLKTIDSIEDLPPAGLIKIDVEGQELEVLEGARNYLKRSGFPPIILEIWDYPWYADKKIRLLNFLISMEYDLVEKAFFNDNNYLVQSKKSSKVILSFQKDLNSEKIYLNRNIRVNS